MNGFCLRGHDRWRQVTIRRGELSSYLRSCDRTGGHTMADLNARMQVVVCRGNKQKSLHIYEKPLEVMLEGNGAGCYEIQSSGVTSERRSEGDRGGATDSGRAT